MATKISLIEVDDETGRELDQDEKDFRFLKHYPDEFLACRGDHHLFPQIRPTRRGRTPKGVRATPEGNGTYLVEVTCQTCGRVRWKIAGPGGVVDPSAGKWRYREPKGYKQPPGSGLTRVDYKQELDFRFIESLQVQGT